MKEAVTMRWNFDEAVHWRRNRVFRRGRSGEVWFQLDLREEGSVREKETGQVFKFGLSQSHGGRRDPTLEATFLSIETNFKNE